MCVLCTMHMYFVTVLPFPSANTSSMSSDEEESSNRQREFQTSFEDDNTKSTHQSALYMTTSPNTLSQITAKASDDSDKMDISSPYNACEFTCSSIQLTLLLCTYMYVYMYTCTCSNVMASTGRPVWSDSHGHCCRTSGLEQRTPRCHLTQYSLQLG